MQGGWPALSGWMTAAAALSALLTALAIRYAHRRRMIDQPGQRRSHSVPTPRGGGIAIVLSILVCVAVPIGLMLEVGPVDSGSDLRRWLLASTIAVLMVAWVGWIDDHGGLSARIRFGAHCFAALVLLSPLAPAIADFWQLDAGPPSAVEILLGVGILMTIALSIVWSINLHNFMDGINGLLACHAIFVFGALGWFDLQFGANGNGSTNWLLAAAVAGFLPFNFPRARIFMGDVGSGALGLLIAIAVLSMAREPTLDPVVAGLVACSAFVTDATATLLSRMLRGRRWYSAHREHLYQWLVRSGYQHASVVGLYMAWNLVVVVPAMLLIQSGQGSMSPSRTSDVVSLRALGVCAVVYALAVVVWVIGKRYSLARVRAGSSHGIA